MTSRSILLVIFASLLVLPACGGAVRGGSSQPSTSPSPSAPAVTGLVFAYGVGARNVLDTNRGTFTWDMVLGPPVTVPMRLTPAEMSRIATMLEAIDFWSYPLLYEPAAAGVGMFPHTSFRFEVTTTAGTKVVEWKRLVSDGRPRTAGLQALAGLIEHIIRSKPAYRTLPEPRGGYL